MCNKNHLEWGRESTKRVFRFSNHKRSLHDGSRNGVEEGIGSKVYVLYLIFFLTEFINYIMLVDIDIDRYYEGKKMAVPSVSQRPKYMIMWSLNEGRSMVVSPYLIEYFFIEIVNNQKNFTHDNRGKYESYTWS